MARRANGASFLHLQFNGPTAAGPTRVNTMHVGRHLGIHHVVKDWSLSVIAHPTPARTSTGRLADSTNRTVSSTEARLALAVLTTDRKAA